MSAPPLLWPNVGAEEGDAAPAGPAGDWVRGVAGLWRMLFAADAGWLGEAVPEVPWPERFGARPAGAAFPWLDVPGAGFAWLNTPEAARRLEAAGRPLWGAPPEVVRRVHDKAFAQRAAEATGTQVPDLAGLIRVFEPEALRDPDAAVATLAAALAGWPDAAPRDFTLKPRLGSSGRGRVAGRDRNPDTPAVRGALPRLAERGGCVLEPWLDRSEDLSASLWIDARGAITLLGTTTQSVAPSGLYLGQRGTFDTKGRVTSGSERDEALREAAAAVAGAAAAAGYHGPCGLDAFAFRLGDRSLFRPVVEWNARFTLGCVAIGLVRRGGRKLASRRGLDAGQRAVFQLGLRPPDGGWPASSGTVTLIPLAAPGAAVQPALVLAADFAALDAALGPPYA